MDVEQEYRIFDPTVIPAQPGFWMASFWLPDDAPLTSRTKPDALVMWQESIIAWIIRPAITTEKYTSGRDEYFESELKDPHMGALTPSGLLASGNYFIIDPLGRWVRPYDETMNSEAEAR